jgi:hypothetical protein
MRFRGTAQRVEIDVGMRVACTPITEWVSATTAVAFQQHRLTVDWTTSSR